MSRESRRKPIQNFTDLVAWREARKLAVSTYKITKDFPAEETFGMKSQIRRAANSIAANIAEGFGRETSNDRSHFYTMALGSLRELQSHVIIACDVQLLSKDSLDVISEQSMETQKILSGLIRSTKSSSFDSRLSALDSARTGGSR